MRASRTRAGRALGVLLTGLSLAGTVVVLAQTPAGAAGRPDFRAPWPCNQARVYRHHSQEISNALDFEKAGGNNDEGLPVNASAAGTVTDVSKQSGYGNTVEIDHGGGWSTRYAHMQDGSITVRKGATIARGIQLGRVGHTGNAQGAHLHFEEQLNNVRQRIVLDGVALKYSTSDNVHVGHNCGSDSPWAAWERLGGTLTHGPGVVNRTGKTLDVYAPGAGEQVYTVAFDGTRWLPWRAVGGTVSSDVAAASWGGSRVDLFGRAADGTLVHSTSTDGGAKFGAWESMGLSTPDTPAAVSWGQDRIDLFARSHTNTLMHRWWNGTQWSAWEDLGGVLTSGPAAASWGAGRLDVFVRGTGNQVFHKWFAGGAWSGFEGLGGTARSTPAAVSRTSGTVDVAVVGTDNSVWHRGYTAAKGWTGWADLGGTATSTPALASWGGTRLDVFTRGTDNALWHTWRS